MSTRFAEASKARLLGVVDGAELRDQNADVASTAAEIALSLCDSGVTLILYRDPDLDVTDMLPIAREICSAILPCYADAKVLIEDRIGVAIAVDAAGAIVADPSVDIADVHITMGPLAWSGVVVSAGKEWPTSSVPDDADLVIVTDVDRYPLKGGLSDLLTKARAIAPTAHILAYVDEAETAETAIAGGADGVAGPAIWLSGADGRELVASILDRYGMTAQIGPRTEQDVSEAADLLAAK